MSAAIIVAGAALVLLGLVGCIVPVLPGPPLGWVGLLMLRATPLGDGVSTDMLVGTGVMAALVTVADYVLPLWTTRRFGGSKWGVWGATIGLLLGLFIFPPLGIIAGPFVGALVGELAGRADGVNPWRSALGSFVGFLLGTGLKLAVSGYIAYAFAQAVIN
ncbi:MAG: DUF456 domain-containing protein [Bacteroidales bacterium]|nr:DUF456 domain-containing protein [Bacteroidales bacterium]